MRKSLIAIVLAACASPTPTADANGVDAFAGDAYAPVDALAGDAWSAPDAFAPIDVGTDANDACVVDYDIGHCISTASCAAMPGYSSTPGLCPGPANIECCSLTPDLTTNPPFPAGYRLLMQSEVTAPMTTWAVMILHDGATYPMFSTTTMSFTSAAGTAMIEVLARVEWHPADFQNSATHRGVTLFTPM